MLELPICDIGCHLDENWNTVVKVIGPNDDIPIPQSLKNLYLDFETTRQMPFEHSINPHNNCKILGVSFLFDNERIPYYIPVRHYYLDENDNHKTRSDIPNVGIEKVHDWLKKIMQVATFWVNHNIKYDLHVYFNELGCYPKAKLICTLNLSKLAAFEERFSYGLTEMMSLVGKDISPYEEEIKKYLKISRGLEYKDYGLIPPDKMATYAAVDVLSCQYLLGILEQKIDPECERVVQLEHNLLPILFQIEQIGIRTNIPKIKEDWLTITSKQVERVQQIKKLTGYDGFQPDKKDSLRELFCNRLGWRMDFTDKTIEKLTKNLITEDEVEYSFDKAAVLKHRSENPELVDVYLEYQKDQKLLTSFTQPYLESHINGFELIHCTNNQIVRTGRLSCTQPNMTQLSKLAKEYIIPYDEDYVLVDFDLSQIEFRVIVHYIGNKRAIEQFNNDPNTDFHEWVATMCGIDRRPAKNINFMLGYGGGMQKCIAMLTAIPEIIGELNTPDLIKQRAYEVYNSYHNTLPELKPTQWRCSDVLRSRGYVRTLLGRRRHIPKQFHFKAFNSVCQGSAADIFKDIAVRLRKFINPECLLHALVHDSFVWSIKKNRVNELVPEIKYEIEQAIEGINFSVPLRSGFGISNENWRFTDEKERIKCLTKNQTPKIEPNQLNLAQL